MPIDTNQNTELALRARIAELERDRCNGHMGCECEVCELKAEVKRLRERDNEVCVWAEDSNDDRLYSTSCGNEFVLLEIGIKENGFKYCAYCGKPIADIDTKQALNDASNSNNVTVTDSGGGE